jgi:hypothetical protein
MGLIKGREPLLLNDLADVGCAGLGGGCDLEVRGEGAVCCDATQSEVVSISNL